MLFQLRNCFHLIKLTQVKTSFVALNLQYRIANVKEVRGCLEDATITRGRHYHHGGHHHHHGGRHHHQGGRNHHMEVATITRKVATITEIILAGRLTMHGRGGDYGQAILERSFFELKLS